MSIDKTCITSVTTAKIAAANTSCTTSDLVSLAASVNKITTDRENYITLACDLPDLNLGTTPEGTMFYVEDIARPVVATATSWVGLDGRTYRKDIDTGPLYASGRYNYGGLLRYPLNSSEQCYFNVNCYSGNWIDAGPAGDESFTAGFGVKQDGTMYQWGFVCLTCNTFICNTTGNCCLSSPVQELCSATNWLQVSAGGRRGSAVKSDGTLWSWGCNNLGNGTTASSRSPVQEFCSDTNWSYVASSGYDAAALKSDGSLWAIGSNVSGIGACCSPVQECLSATWIAVDLRSGTTTNGAHAVKSDGTLWGWGRNCCGQLGYNSGSSTVISGSPVQEASSSSTWCQAGAGNYSSAGIKTDGTLWSWGTRPSNGVWTTTAYSSPVQEICSATNWCYVTQGTSGIGIKADGTMWGWGQNYCYSLGLGTASGPNTCSPVQEGNGFTDWWKVCNYGSLSYAIRNC